MQKMGIMKSDSVKYRLRFLKPEVWQICLWEVPQVIRLIALRTSRGQIYPDNACGFSTVCHLQNGVFLGNRTYMQRQSLF